MAAVGRRLSAATPPAAHTAPAGAPADMARRGRRTRRRRRHRLRRQTRTHPTGRAPPAACSARPRRASARTTRPPTPPRTRPRRAHTASMCRPATCRAASWQARSASRCSANARARGRSSCAAAVAQGSPAARWTASCWRACPTWAPCRRRARRSGQAAGVSAATGRTAFFILCSVHRPRDRDGLLCRPAAGHACSWAGQREP